jgi:hypothetical protein
VLELEATIQCSSFTCLSLASGVIVQMFIPVQTDGYGLEAN